jgi:hypothetical protein
MGYKTSDTVSVRSSNIKVLQVIPKNATVIKNIKAGRCKYAWGDPTPTRADITNDLTIEASYVFADGIAEVDIFNPGTGIKNCLSILEGTAVAFKYSEGSPGGKQNIEMMISDAKKTCKTLGFKEGTQQFSDCSLKLYSQSVELAAEQNKTIVMQPQSSGSNVMTIYDPVRDNNALMKQGQRMISGRCTLGIDC